jgi:hypothetical protein
MMRFLLILIICSLAIGDMFGLSLSLGAGMSVKNLLLYAGAAWLLLQSALGRPVKVELQTIQTCFAVLILYAAVTMFIASSVVHYSGYKLVDSAIALKISFVDWIVYFLVFFYGARTIADARTLLKFFLFIVSLGNLFTIAKALGIISLGADIWNGGGETVTRVNGIFGDANETATMIACLLPVYVSVILSEKGFGKIFWVACTMFSAVVMFMATSRGALVGLLLGSLWAAYLCRRYLSFRLAFKWGSIILAIAAIVALVAGGGYLELYIHRFTDVSLASAADLSSGRSDIWGRGLEAMMNSPVTLITGFGWDTWSVMGFSFVAHNHYLLLWFELGLVGVVCMLVIFRQLVTTALATVAVADSPNRDYIVAFVFSFLILGVGVFFVLLGKPWFYLWSFIGLAMRYTVEVRAAHRINVDPQPARKLPQSVRTLNASARSTGSKSVT